MAEKEKKPEFVVTDRRLFSSEGELRQDVVEAEERREEREQEKREAQQRANEERAAQNHQVPAPEVPAASSVAEPEVPAPSSQEQQASAAAYQESTREIDEQIQKEMRKQGQSHRPQDFEITFEKFLASLYMTALMQLGMAAPQGAKPEVDLIGARQTVDTLALLQEKTKGNLTPAEDNMMRNCLYELRMAYLEVTNLITRPPQGSPGGDSQVG
jgi:hypothetical protein